MSGNVIVFSGAGLSAESGISTFRDGNGLWHNHRISEVCDYLTWKHHFDKVHEFYNERRANIGAAKPNHAHQMLADWQKRYNAIMLTQNIDDLLERAGCDNVVHLHGRGTEMICEACGHRWDIRYRVWNANEERCPRCPSRKGVKPGVVFFNEAAPNYRIMHHEIAHISPKDILIVIGTSANVINIGSMLEHKPGYKILNNLAPSTSALLRNIEETVYDECFFEPATKAVNAIDAILRERLG